MTFDFDDLKVIWFPVRLLGKWYVCREADGGAGTTYRNGVFSAVKAAKGGENISVQGMADPHPELVRNCTFHAVEVSDGSLPGEDFPWGESTVRLSIGDRITASEVAEWPDRVMHKVFKELQRVSELTDFEGDLRALKKNREALTKKIDAIAAADKSAKNDQRPTEDGSD